MYQLSIQEEFVAQHFLTVPDCGPENLKHSHIYALEVLLESDELNEYGYLVDIDDVKTHVANILNLYRDKTLNDTPAFKGLNPSIEHFSRIVCTQLINELDTRGINSVTVRIWEDRNCWASYSLHLAGGIS